MLGLSLARPGHASTFLSTYVQRAYCTRRPVRSNGLTHAQGTGGAACTGTVGSPARGSHARTLGPGGSWLPNARRPCGLHAHHGASRRQVSSQLRDLSKHCSHENCALSSDTPRCFVGPLIEVQLASYPMLSSLSVGPDQPTEGRFCGCRLAEIWALEGQNFGGGVAVPPPPQRAAAAVAPCSENLPQPPPLPPPPPPRPVLTPVRDDQQQHYHAVLQGFEPEAARHTAREPADQHGLQPRKRSKVRKQQRKARRSRKAAQASAIPASMASSVMAGDGCALPGPPPPAAKKRKHAGASPAIGVITSRMHAVQAAQSS